MGKNTVIAIVLSVAILVGFNFLQPLFNGGTKTNQTVSPAEKTSGVEKTKIESLVHPTEDVGVSEQKTTIKTNLFEATFTNKGGELEQVKLIKHFEADKRPIEMINKQGQSPEETENAFELNFGGNGNAKVKDLFQVEQKDPFTVEFSRKYIGQDGAPFTLRKTFLFKKEDYLFELRISLDSEGSSAPKIDKETAYTLTFGPQIGPTFKDLSGQSDYRKFFWMVGDSRSEIKPGEVKEQSAKWYAIVGKYFAAAIVPDRTTYKVTSIHVALTPATQKDYLKFERAEVGSSRNTDVFKIYIGPKENKTLNQYVDEGNLSKLIDDNWLWWFEVALKFIMEKFHDLLIPNWGVAIIFLTVLIKLLTWPLTNKSFQATAGMQKLQPKLKELQEKYKSDPEKLNKLTMELYQKEKINPLGGCLPMIIQIPIFMVLYNMFSNQFDLRGAMFIPGWIPDLSVPEHIFSLGFSLPIVNWTDIRLLPILMSGSQIIMTLWTQPQSVATTQGKVMTFALPVVFFFMLYNMPSGLMVYWTLSNVLSALQQWLINVQIKNKPQRGK